MADTDIKLSVDLDVKDAEKTAQQLHKEINDIFASRNGQQSPQLMSLQRQMKSNVLQAQKLQDEIKRLRDIKLAGDEFDRIGDKMRSLQEEADSFQAALSQMTELSHKSGTPLANMRLDLGGELYSYDDLKATLAEINGEYEALEKKQNVLGKVHPEILEASAMQKVEQQLSSTEVKLDSVNDKMKQNIVRSRELEAQEENTGKKGEGAFTALISKASALLAVLKAIGKVVMWLPTKVWNTGKKFYTSVFQKLISGTKTIINGIRKITVSAGKLFNKFNIFSKGNNSPVKQLLRNILRYGLGISSIMVLFNKLRNNITGNLKDIIAKSGEAKTAYDNLKLSIGQLSHQVSAIFEPVLKSLEPLLTMIIERLNQAALAVTKFIGAITGQSKILKARKNLNALADSAGEASKQLSGLDNLNVLSSDKGGGAGAGDADWYDWEDIDPKYLDFWQRIKDEWEKDVPDFTWLGKMLADRITLALSNIDWAKIFKNAMKLGVSLATFLNGFFDEDMLKALGEAIANAINTAIYFAWSFLEAFNFGQFGTNIAQGFVNLINGIDWEALVEAIQMGFDGVLLAVRNFVNKIIDPEEGIDFERLRKNLETAIINTFNSLTSFVQNLHWNTLKDRIIEFFSFDVTSIATSISNFLNELAQQDVVRNFTDIILNILGTTTAQNRSTMFDADGNILFKGLEGAGPIRGSSTSTGLAGFFEQLILNTDINTIVSDISDLFVRILNRVRDNITDLMSTLSDKVDASNLGSAIHGIIDAVLNLGISILTNEKFQSWVQEVLANVKLDELAEKFGQLVLGAWEFVRDITPWDKLLPVIEQILLDIWNIGSEIVYDVAEQIGKQILAGIGVGLGLGLATIKATISQICLQIMGLFIGIWKIGSPSKVSEEWGVFIIEGLALGIKNTIQQVLDKLTKLKDKMLTKANEIKDKTVEKWTAMKDTLIGVIDALKEGIKTPINGIISFFEGMVNSAIDGINLLAGKINAIGDLGVFDFVPNIPELGYVQLPRLAQGAVIPPNREFLAMLGDQKSGVNIETPLDTMKEAFLEALSQAGIGGNGTQQIVLQLDGKTFMTAMVKQNNEYTKRTGHSAFA